MFEHIHVSNSSSADGGWGCIIRRRQPFIYIYRDFVEGVVAARLAVALTANAIVADVKGFES